MRPVTSFRRISHEQRYPLLGLWTMCLAITKLLTPDFTETSGSQSAMYKYIKFAILFIVIGNIVGYIITH